MCGPIASLMAQRNNLRAYHLGRGLSYVTLGVLGGYLGQFFLESQFVTLRWISAGLMALVLILMGAGMIDSRFQVFSSHLISQSMAKVFRQFGVFQVQKSGFAVGILTALLPCGWLYTYVLAAVATQSPATGAFLMGLFWLGGLPALTAVSSMVKTAVLSSKLRQQKIAGGILVFAGLYSITSFLFFHSL